MRIRTLVLAAALLAGLVHDSDAVVPPKGAEAPLVAADRAPRTHRTAPGKLGPLSSVPVVPWKYTSQYWPEVELLALQNGALTSVNASSLMSGWPRPKSQSDTSSAGDGRGRKRRTVRTA